MSKTELNLIGGGPVGCLLALHFAKKAYKVNLFERRPDIRTEKIPAGRSINLALSTRGIFALQELGVDQEILARAIPMFGRMMHAPNGELTFQRYGLDDSQYISSISRAELNRALLSKAEASEQVKISFSHRLEHYDFASQTLKFKDEKNGTLKTFHAPHVVGCDGSASALRVCMQNQLGAEVSEEPLNYGYKELTIPARPNGLHALEKNALHIWPRGSHMLIALPNFDGSFTCTLFLPWKGPQSFENLNTASLVRSFFAAQFPDAAVLIENLEESFAANPTGHMVTVRTKPWNYKAQALLMGDAAHAIVPFFGQGLNCGFEDCTLLGQLLKHTTDLERVFGAYYSARKEDADAIATLALDNFIEMRDKVAQPRFLLEKGIEKILMREFADEFISRYSLVTFSRKPYRLALAAGRVQDRILSKLSENVSKPEEVNLELAKSLIHSELVPLMKAHAKEF